MALGELEVKKSTLTVKELHWKIPGFFSLQTDEVHVGPHFTFLNFDWDVNIEPSDSNSEVYLRLDVVDGYVGRSYDMMCTVGIVKTDGSVDRIQTFFRTLCRGYLKTVSLCVIHTEVLLRYKTELVPLDNLTIMCYIELLCDPMELRELNTLSENIQGPFANEELCDTTLDVKGKKFKVHKAIIAARSSEFAAMFKHEAVEKETGVIRIPDCHPESFKLFLKYLYSGKFENLSFRCVVHVFKIAHKFGVKELMWFCMDWMRQDMKIENFVEVIALAEEYGCDRLNDAVQDFFNRNLGEIFESDEWQNLLKTNFNLANKLLIEMSSCVEVVRKRARLEIS